MRDSYGEQRTPHKYVKRLKHGGKFVYVYASDTQKKLDDVLKGTAEHRVVIAHGRPLPIFVDAAGVIVSGPPQTVGKRLFVSTNPSKSYFGVARDEYSSVYLYPESQLKKAISKKSSKIVKARNALDIIDTHANRLMQEPHNDVKQLGMIMWLNNNTRLRIGAHENAASVDPSERQKILSKARVEGWSENDKRIALEQARTPTFGLMTLRAGHVRLDPAKKTVSFVFRGKGGKMVTDDTVSVSMDQTQYSTMDSLLTGKAPDDKVFPDIEYKKVWRIYKKFGVTPHVSRSHFADSMVSAILQDFSTRPDEGAREAMKRLRDEIKTKVSDRLGHTQSMTMRAYVSEKTSNAYNAISSAERNLQESDIASMADYGDLAEVITWLEIGPGNVVV